MFYKSLTLLILIFILIPNLHAQEKFMVSEKPISFASEITLYSAFLKEQQKIHVYLPEGYESAAEHIEYPVIYALDGWALSQTVSGVVNHLGITAAMPKSIVIAIHNDDDYAYGPELYQSKSGWGDDPSVRLSQFSGGEIDSYMNFLEEELIPFVDQQYRTNHFRVFVGMSPSAAVGLHTFWKAPDLFDAHFLFAATDVIGMGYTPETTFIDKIAQSMKENPNRKGYLYIASAKLEADRNPIRNENIAKLNKTLKPYTNKYFKFKAEHIEEFGHYPMVVPGLLNAINLVFPRSDWNMSKQFRILRSQPGNALENILSYYEKLSEQVGFKVNPNTDLRRNASCYRVAAYRLRSQKRLEESEQIYKQWILDEPNSAKAHYGLAVTLEDSKQLNSALIYSEKALKLATNKRSPNIEIYRKLFLELQEKVNANK